MKTRSLTLAALGMAVVACTADRGPTKGTPTDSGTQKEATADVARGVCPAPSGGNDLSVDLICTGLCPGTTHLDFHLDAKSPSYPGCAIGDDNLEFGPDVPATGMATMSLDVPRYAGPGQYTLAATSGNMDLLFKLGDALVVCSDGSMGGTDEISELILNGPQPEGGSPGLDAGAASTCTVDVDTDCANDDGAHTVKGTLSCSFAPLAGVTCTLTNGQFQFGACSP